MLTFFRRSGHFLEDNTEHLHTIDKQLTSIFSEARKYEEREEMKANFLSINRHTGVTCVCTEVTHIRKTKFSTKTNDIKNIKEQVKQKVKQEARVISNVYEYSQ